jgi:hypothetical protein
MIPYAVSLIAVVSAAWLYHGITEHHWHRALLHAVDSSVTVPPPVYTSRWHSLGHGRRAVIDLVLLGAAGALGYGWQVSPVADTVTLAVAVVIIIAARGARMLSKSLGGRHHWEED